MHAVFPVVEDEDLAPGRVDGHGAGGEVEVGRPDQGGNGHVRDAGLGCRWDSRHVPSFDTAVGTGGDKDGRRLARKWMQLMVDGHTVDAPRGTVRRKTRAE